MTWGPYLYTTVGNTHTAFVHPWGRPHWEPFALQSLLDDVGLADVSSAAQAVQAAVAQQQFEKATELWSVAETVVEQVRGLGVTLQQKNKRLKFGWE